MSQIKCIFYIAHPTSSMASNSIFRYNCQDKYVKFVIKRKTGNRESRIHNNRCFSSYLPGGMKYKVIVYLSSESPKDTSFVKFF